MNSTVRERHGGVSKPLPQKARMNERIKVESSVLAAVTQIGKKTLVVEFNSGTSYKYRHIPEETRDAFMATSGSWGEAFNALIKPYPFKRLV